MTLAIRAADPPGHTKVPASIRHKNPGAMWPGKSSKKFGSTRYSVLRDRQRNQMATFATSVQGAAAQMYLLSRPLYLGKTIGEAIATWSGGNNTNDYLRKIERRTHWTRQDYITKGLLTDQELAIKLCKAMAYHEAGREYPMTDAQWREAHALFMSALNGEKIKVVKAAPLKGAPWMDIARAAKGTKEISGSRDNPEIMAYYADAGHPGIKHDETPWCAAFACAMLERSGCANPKTLAARDFLEYGEPIDEPEEGCIVVFWRGSPNGWQGHVGFVESWTPTTLKVLGGNQANSVSVQTWKRGTGSRVLGYRRPLPATRSLTEIASTESVKRKVVGGGATLGVLMWSVWNSVTSWVGYAVDGIGQMVGILPDTAATVQTTVASGKVLSESAGVPWPVQLTLLIVLCAAGYGVYGTVKRMLHVNPWATEGVA